MRLRCSYVLCFLADVDVGLSEAKHAVDELGELGELGEFAGDGEDGDRGAPEASDAAVLGTQGGPGPSKRTSLGRPRAPPFARGHRIDFAGRRARAQVLLLAHDVRPPDGLLRAGALSSGNQQKLLGVLRGMGAGAAAVAGVHGWLSIRLKSDQVVSRMALNLVMLALGSFLLEAVFSSPSSTPSITQLPRWWGHSPLTWLAFVVPVVVPWPPSARRGACLAA